MLQCNHSNLIKLYFEPVDFTTPVHYVTVVLPLYMIFFSLLQQDVFELEAVSLDEVEHIVVSHDKKGSQPSWFLDKVIIRSDDNPDKDYRFNCSRSVQNYNYHK